MHNGRDHCGCDRNRQADKVTLRTRLGLGLQIKTRQAKRSTSDTSKAGQRSKLMYVPGSTAFDARTDAETPVESQYRWSDAERDDIGNESSWRPKSLVVLVKRAMRPSSPSRTSPLPM